MEEKQVSAKEVSGQGSALGLVQQHEDAGRDEHGHQQHEEKFEVEHSGRRFLARAKSPQLAVARLRQQDQLLPERETRLGGCTFQKVADGCLATPADRGDLHLAKTALLNT